MGGTEVGMIDNDQDEVHYKTDLDIEIAEQTKDRMKEAEVEVG